MDYTYIFEVTADGNEVKKFDLDWSAKMSKAKVSPIQSYSRANLQLANIRDIDQGKDMITVHQS